MRMLSHGRVNFRRTAAWIHTFSLLTVFLMVAGIADAEEDFELKPIVVGKPQRIEAFPETIHLSGSRRQAQFVVTGYYANGEVQDLTRIAKFESSNEQVVTVSQSVAYPQGNGKAQIAVRVGEQQVEVEIETSAQEKKEPVSFSYETLAALSKQSCNSGACHGSPSGKGGFRMSLRAFDPEVDKFTLIREALGRRTNPLHPEKSLLLAKPTMKIPHGGGFMLKKTDPAYTILHDWIAAGCRLDPEDAPKCVKIEVYPPSGRLLKRPAHTQQLSVLAHFSDGSIRDVTTLAVFSSSDEEVASVSKGGLVVGHDRGEAAVIVRYLEFIEANFITFVKDIEGFVWNNAQAHNYVDKLVYEKLQQLKYLPADPCSDAVFIRRVYLDVIGILPTIDQVEPFLASDSSDKRSQLIDELLDRPEFAKFWALKWCDLLRVTKKQLSDKGMRKYHRWVERAFDSNMPYDQFAIALLTSVGSTLDNPPANYYRAAADTNDALETTAQIFLASRIQCAKCHNHPFERWTQDNYYGMSSFFNRIQRKNTNRPDEQFIWVARQGEVTQPRTGRLMKPWVPGAGQLEIAEGDDRRLALAAWLRDKDNPIFAKVEANRLWAQVMGRGIVEPYDDFRDSNPPSNAALLDALAKDFIEHKFDRKHILRTILNSNTYQASAMTNDLNKDDQKYCSHYQPRMLSAEQLLDAIGHVVALPEQFQSVPEGTKATQLPSPDIANSEFLKIFGQPERQTACQCERSGDSNLGQALQLYNGSLVHNKLRDKKNRIYKMIEVKMTDRQIISQLYLAAYCRQPEPTELQAGLAHLQNNDNRSEALEDICWAIINTNEFLFQH